jgi:hypothetical protein
MDQDAKLTREQRNQASIDDYADDLKNIWPRDLERPVLFQWLRVVTHASRLAEEVRKEAWGEVLHQVAEVFVWWLAFVNRINVPPGDVKPGSSNSDQVLSDAVLYVNCAPSDIVWHRFPRICPVCFGYILCKMKDIPATQEKMEIYNSAGIEVSDLRGAYNNLKNKPCACLVRKEWVEKRSKAFKSFVEKHVLGLATMIKETEKPNTLSELEQYLQQVFNPAVAVLSADQIAFHLLEEVGEVSDALTNLHLQPSNREVDFIDEHKRRLQALQLELADVFSWIVTMRAKTYYILQSVIDYLREENTRNAAKALLGSTSSIIELVWDTYGGSNGLLWCEDCKQRPCRPQHQKHRATSGQLFGKAVEPYFEQIRTLKGSEQS